MRGPLGGATLESLTAEEELIVRVATATCFAYGFEAGEVPLDDVRLYVREIINLYKRKPLALTTGGWDPEVPDIRAAVQFCAERLAGTAPDQAAELLAVLTSQ